MTHQEVLRLIQNQVDAHQGSIRALARKWRVSAAYLSDILLEKRYPGPKVLRKLGLVGKVHTTKVFTAQSKEAVNA